MLKHTIDPPPPPTDEQTTIYTAAATTPDNLMVGALAGTGKSHVLENIQHHLPKIRPLQTRDGPKRILYLVFNRKNADEAKDKMLSTTDVRTFNGCGHRVWMSGGRSLTVEGKKTHTILREVINSTKSRFDKDRTWAIYDQVVQGVGFAKSLGYIPDGVAKCDHRLISQSTFLAQLEESPDDFVSDLIDTILRRSIGQAYNGLIDFDDQVYMPTLFGGSFPKYPYVLVDEYQDLSPVNHALIAKLGFTRLIGVGDPWQNIYGFRGATAQGMDTAVGAYAMAQHALSISFRCPSAIVNHVHWRVPHFRAFREGGRVNVPTQLLCADIPDTATVICRNNAPLFAMAFKLIGDGHSVNIAGSDIGFKLVGIMKRLGDSEMSQRQTLSAINDWEAEKLANESTTAADMAACMRVFARQADSLSLAISYANHLFKQSGSISLMTGHKSKGLEFPYVIHLDPQLLGGAEQDLNLRYVISTRSQDTLTEIASDRIVW